ncbi:MAG: hypothetical protein RSP_04800 [Rhodanobacter sp.]
MCKQEKTCNATGKHRYCTASEAHSAVVALKRRGHSQRPYRCEHCHGWHTTHYMQELRFAPKRRSRFRTHVSEPNDVQFGRMAVRMTSLVELSP